MALIVNVGIEGYKPWSGAISTWNEIEEANKVDELEYLLVEGYVGVYSDYEGCTSMVYIKGIIEVSIKEDRISYILSDNLELISSEYDGVLWEDIIMELEDTLRTCYKVIKED